MPDEPHDRFPEPPSDEEIEARLRRIVDGVRGPEMPEAPSDEELQAQAQDLQSNVARAGETRMPEPPDWNYERKPIPGAATESTGSYRGLAHGLAIGYGLIGPPLAGYGIGWLIDRGGTGNTGVMYGTLIGAVAGLVMCVILVGRFGDKVKKGP